ncbi:MAG: ABC transporter ATP-binding protein [Caldilineaceae bacterium]
MLTLQGVSKRFEQLVAVDDLSLTVQAGQLVGLVGPNGSGKSTLLNVIAGALAADHGHIHFAGHDITRSSAAEIFQFGLARSFQDPSLFGRMSVLDNMLLPVKGQLGERPTQAPWRRRWLPQEYQFARQANAELRQVQLQKHYDNQASDLSGGQMKLLALSRTLMGAPQLLLLDEPTAGVAPALAYAIFERIADLRRNQGLTFLIVEHRLEILFEFVDYVYVMHLGRIIAQGTPAEIEANAQVREVYFGE